MKKYLISEEYDKNFRIYVDDREERGYTAVKSSIQLPVHPVSGNDAADRRK